MNPFKSPLRFEPVPTVCSWAGAQAPRRLPACSAHSGSGDGVGIYDFIEGTFQRGNVVTAGPSDGGTLERLVQEYGPELLGRRGAGQSFPLGVRILDIGRDLPLWVHPAPPEIDWGGTATTKFWYSLAGEPDAAIAVGLRVRVTRDRFLRNLDSPDLLRHLQVYPGRPGDAFLILPGRVHTATAGNLLLEVVRNDARPAVLSEFGERRPAPEERRRAVNGIRFEDRQVGRISREAARPPRTRRVPLVPHCPAFTVDEVRLVDHVRDRTTGESFHLLAVVRGTVRLVWDDDAMPLQTGAVCCVPATFGPYSIEAEDGPADYLRVTL
ncbi:MAG: hypothetical protein GXP31_04765 [Kiritimatiellaeota bacterium]|nr:hypothetical protein [Kiritimatiellota bacterium]